jgi:hypothetical protein
VGEVSILRDAFARPRARDAPERAVGAADTVALRLHRKLGAAAKSLLLSGSHSFGAIEPLRRAAIDDATHALHRHEPQYSAARVFTPAQRTLFLVVALGLAVCIAISPAVGGLVLTALIAASYAANAIFRAWLFWVGSDEPTAQSNPGENATPTDLPIYTVLVPLYREATVVAQLAAALRRLDYPPHLLDVKLVVEEDDDDTVAAAVEASADGVFEVVAVPPGEPRTKPRACNYALQLARGDFLVIFDAEDRPEPDQLKKALQAFRRAPADVACLQARLNFFNARECWLTSGIMAQTPQASGTA